MRELYRRLALYPVLTTEILIATFFITLLSLASPLFVIQVLNRYVTFGFSGTLITLTMGMMVAIVMQFAFRMIRTKIAAVISVEPDIDLSRKVLHVLTRAKALPIGNIPKPAIHETVNGLQAIKAAYSAAGITSILDAPFALIFLLASFFISPALALISLAGVVLSLIGGAFALKFSNRIAEQLKNSTLAHRASVLAAANNIDTVRSFRGIDFLKTIWDNQIRSLTEVQQRDADIKEFSQTQFLTISVLMSVVLYAVGAMEVVQGKLTVGALIGANILAGRAFSSTTRFVQTSYLLAKAGQAFRDLATFFKLPLEPGTGTGLASYSGAIEFKDLGLAFPGSKNPLFESLSLKIQPGEVLTVTGHNGAGKTSLLRLLAGLLEPSRGEILVDEINLMQIAPEWWRSQLIYLPQEPTFLNATIRDSITMANPELDNSGLNQVVNLADLRSYLDKSPRGLETELLENGRNLPLGIRRRIALARGLATNGRLVLFDEPTEGLDIEGRRAVYAVMNKLIKEKKTMVVVSGDPVILKDAPFVLDLSRKPVPEIVTGNNKGQTP
ncbi:MAG: ATP-binding cassette domain-containing protein [Desulfobacterales bacterium]|nr:ATP-binding cassette domain-containing protein [Desulfobacterales bacterium]